jgi:hypothetical protein
VLNIILYVISIALHQFVDSSQTKILLPRLKQLIPMLVPYYTFVTYSVAEPQHFYAVPAPGKNFDAAPAPAIPASAPTLPYSSQTFF